MQKNSHLLLISIFFMCLIVSSRFFVLYQHAVSISFDYTVGILLGSVNSFVLGLVVSIFVIFFNQSILKKFITFIIVTLIFFFEIACFHYEAEFGRLPSSDILYYFTETEYLAPSLNHNLPFIELFFEVLIALVLFYSFVYWIQKIKIKSLFSKKLLEYTGSIVILISIVIQVYPAMVPDKYFWGSREPILWMLQSKFIRESYEIENLKLNKTHFNQFLKYHGINSSKPLLDPAFPGCQIPGFSNKKPLQRNVVFLILESVGEPELWKQFNAKPMMPNLQEIAKDGLYFNNIYAPGIKSVQALPSIFSGLPAGTYANYLWHAPMINFNGFPLKLSKQGYSTAYFHGSDLSFEQQREYLKAVGFQTFFEYDPDLDKPVIAWGYDDKVMFEKLKKWLIENRQPSFTSLFTLSTHEPYVLPADWEPNYSETVRTLPNPLDPMGVRGEKDTITAMAETYSFLDFHLGEFYSWLKEFDKDAILVITGDHAPHIVNNGKGIAETDFRFKVPFIIAGLSDHEKSKYENYSDRLGGLHDIPATLLDILGYPKMECDLGISLISPASEWPTDRYTYSVGGDSLEKIYIRQKSDEYVYDRVKKQLLKSTYEGRVEPDEVEKEKILSFLNTLNAVHYYLLKKDAFSPEVIRHEYLPVNKVSKPIFISHRGNLTGEGTPLIENRPGLLDKVLQSELSWVEVDVRLTKDGIPVLLHDDFITVDGNSIQLSALSYSDLISFDDYKDVLTLEAALDRYAADLNMLIDVKPVFHIQEILHITREVSRIINEKKDKKRIIVDSFHDTIARSIKNQCNCEVGYDTPYQKKLSEADLRYYKNMGMDWIYVHYSVIDSQLIQNAHLLGLKVMAYTVNSDGIVDDWRKAELPDGIITDNEKIVY